MMTTAQNSASGSAAPRRPNYTRLRRALFEQIMNTPRGHALKRRQWNLLKQLLAWVNPMTGELRHPTMNATLERELKVSTRTLARARHELMDLGLIRGYQPGDGKARGLYAIALSWDEADAAAEERARNGKRPYFPPLPQRAAQPAAAEQGQADEQPAARRGRRRRAEPVLQRGLSADRLPSHQRNEAYHAERNALEADPRTAPDNPRILAAQEAARAAARKAKQGRENAPPDRQTGDRPAA